MMPGHRRQWTTRTAVGAAITAAHIAAIALAFFVRGPRLDVEPAGPVAVSLLAEQHNEPLPQLPRPQDVVMPEVAVPQLINIDFPLETASPVTVVVNSPPPPTVPAPPAVSPVPRGDAGEPVMATTVEYERPPVVSYPAAAKQARATGTAHIRAVVETDGHVREVRVDRSSGHASLDKAARESVRGALFRPYMLNGVARAAIVIVPVNFELKTQVTKRDNRLADKHCGKPAHSGRDRDEKECLPDGGGP